MKTSDRPGHSLPFMWRIIMVSLAAIIIFITSVILFGNHKTVLVGYPLIDGFQGINKNGEYYGYNHEMIQRIAKHNRWNVEYVIAPYNELYDRVKKGEIDVLGGVNDIRKNQRDEVAFVQYSNGSDRSIILSNSIRSFLNNYDALHLKRIGFLENMRSYDELIQIAGKYGIQFYPEFYQDYDDLMKAMNKNEVDAISISSQYSFPLTSLIAEYHLSDYYFVTTLNNTEILNDMNEALAMLRRQYPSFPEELDQFFYHEMNTTKFISKQEKQQNLIFLTGSVIIGLGFLLVLFFYIVTQSADQKLLKKELFHSMINDEFRLFFTPISSYNDRTKQMFTLQYYCDNKTLGQIRKEDMIKLQGFILPLMFRIHEFRVLGRNIREVRKLDQYKDAKFIISMHASYHSWWPVVQLSFMLRLFMRHYRIHPNVLLFSFSSTHVNDQKTKYSVSSTCRKLGISFVMNDFGMQFSSLSQIKKIDYEYFKVDRIYTSDFTYNDMSMQIIKLIVNIAASLQKKVIIDGIDDEATYENAKSLGCHYMQGKYVGSQMSLAEVLNSK